MPYRDLSFAFNAWYPPARTVCHEQPVTELSDELLDAFVARVREPAGDAIRNIETIPRRGALGRAPEIPTVLRETGEEPTWMVVPVCMWQDESEDESHLRWTEHVYEDICRIGPAVDRARPNTVAVPLDLDGVARLYGDRFERLRGLKRQWDPENVFHGNHNIPPADD